MKQYKNHINFIIILLILSLLISLISCSEKKEEQGEEHYYQLGVDLFKEGYYELIPEGKVEEGRKKLDQAINSLEVAISMNDRSVESHYLLARIYVVLAKYKEAAEQYNRVIELDPRGIDNYLFLASAYVQMKQYTKAHDVLNHAKTLTEDVQTVERIEALVQSIKENE